MNQSLAQCFLSLVLKAYWSACLRCFPAATHLIRMIEVQQKSSIKIRRAGAGKHTKHAGGNVPSGPGSKNTALHHQVL